MIAKHGVPAVGALCILVFLSTCGGQSERLLSKSFQLKEARSLPGVMWSLGFLLERCRMMVQSLFTTAADQPDSDELPGGRITCWHRYSCLYSNTPKLDKFWGIEGAKMAPHMTHFRMRTRPGERQKVIDHFDLWQRGRRHQAGGFVRFVLCSNVNDPDEFMAYAMFADKKAYDANSDHPEQHVWYETLRSYLASDPEWFDGTVELQRMGQV